MSVRTGQAAEIPPPERSPQRGAAAPFVERREAPPPFWWRNLSPPACPVRVFFVKTRVLCPAAALGVFFCEGGGPENWPRLEVGRKVQNVESSQNGLAYRQL